MNGCIICADLNILRLKKNYRWKNKAILKYIFPKRRFTVKEKLKGDNS